MQIKQDILEAIKNSKTIIIHRHVRPDPDAVGSQKGLAAMIQASFPDKDVFTAGQMTDSLVDLMGDINPPTAADYTDALVIVTDTANTARLDGLEDILNIDQVIKIDHHPNEEPYGDIIWVDDQASSCSEMITELWQTFSEELKLTDDAAQWLYTGIVGDTNRFMYASTTGKTMHLAGELMQFSFDHAKIHYQMNAVTAATARLMSYVLANFKSLKTGAGYLIFTQELMDQLNVTDEQTSAIVSLPGRLEGVLAWIIFVQQPDGHYRARLRSKGPAINGLASRHDGGGHDLASGANAKDNEEITQMIEELEMITQDWMAE